MLDKLQIGTIAYKQDNKYKKAFPLLMEETEELKQATRNLFNVACEMFITDLFTAQTQAGFVLKKMLAKNLKIKGV